MSEPTVTGLPRPDVVLDVDLDAEVPCAACGEDAAIWWLTQLPCGHGYPVCDWCHDTVLTLTLPASEDVVYGCDRCDSIALAVQFRRL